MICYAFPLAHEAASLLKLCTHQEKFSVGDMPCVIGNLGERRVLITLVGMGEKNARARVADILKYFHPRIVVLAGYGGALIPQLKIGQIMVSNNYSSNEAVSYLRGLAAFDFGVFYTSDKIVGTPAERDRAARTGSAQVIEMETAGAAELVNDSSAIFIAVRVISDDYANILPVKALAAGFDPTRGRPTPLRLLFHLATHRKDIKPFKQFVANLSIARQNLTAFLLRLNEDLPRR